MAAIEKMLGSSPTTKGGGGGGVCEGGEEMGLSSHSLSFTDPVAEMGELLEALYSASAAHGLLMTSEKDKTLATATVSPMTSLACPLSPPLRAD